MNVDAAEFDANPSLYRSQSKREPVTVKDAGAEETVLVSGDVYRLLSEGRIAETSAEFDHAVVEEVRNARMDPQHDHLDAMLDGWDP